jgi:hypothetical protein
LIFPGTAALCEWCPNFRNEVAMENVLSPYEIEVLIEIVEEHLLELRAEIRETDNYEYKQGLKLKEQTT